MKLDPATPLSIRPLDLHKSKRWENLHIYFWLLKDLGWIAHWIGFALLMIIPAVGFAVAILWIQRRHRAELFHNTAVLLWIIANSIWMIGELLFDDSIRAIAIVFFVLGISILSWYYVRCLTRWILVARHSQEIGPSAANTE